MLPIRDTIRSFSFPLVNWMLIGLNTVVFLFELTLSRPQVDRLVAMFGLVPARFNPDTILSEPLVLVTFITHMFLHGGWLHFLSNMWILYIFGDNVEDRMGSWRYLFFYLFSGIAAGLTQIVFDAGGQIPAVGASGAIAGVLGAYFLLFPRSRVITLIPLFFIPWFVEIPALFYLGFWFLSQLFSGVLSIGMPGGMEIGGVAWWAHIGGFVFGLFLVRIFTPRRHPAYTRLYPDEYWPY